MTSPQPSDPRRSVERVARESYGRLVAYLSVHTHDLSTAEDALSDALLKALTVWPRDGVPANPEAWLLTVARRALIDGFRHQQVVDAGEPTLLLLTRQYAHIDTTPVILDERLKLLFVCAHPDIDAAMHTPLMLQSVLGLDAARIGAAFLVSPKTMGQRLVRAKARIREARIPFEVPDSHDLPARLDAVLEAIYAAYGVGWDNAVGADPRARALTEESLWLARVLVELMPAEPEARGLLALVLHCEARRAARRDSAGRYVPLSEQDPALWSIPLIREAESNLAEAFTHGRAGRFQLEAAIQSVHAERARGAQVEWPAIVGFYRQLLRIAPTLGTRTGHAAAVAEAEGPAAGLAILDALNPIEVASYQPYWAVRARLLQLLGRAVESVDAYDRAIGLAEDPAVRAFLILRRG
jgi:predicted RNA polymerase sigma factor